MKRSSSGRAKKPKHVSWASDDKLCQISDPNRAKFDAVPSGYGGSYSAKQSRERIHVPCIHWTCPPKFAVSSDWVVATGEASEQAGAEDSRELKVLEWLYPRSIYIPSSPFVSSDVAQEHYDDTLTPIIPIISIEEMETVSETPSVEPLEGELENKTSNEEQQVKSSGVETIRIGDVELPVGDAELAAAAAVMFFTILVKSSGQGKMVDFDLLVKFFHDPQMIRKFLKNENPSSESKQASPQISQSSPPLSLPESKQTTLSLPMSSPELPPTKSEPTPEVLPSELKQLCPPNLMSPSHPPIRLSSPKRFVPVSKVKRSPAPPSSPNLLRPPPKKIQPPTPPASPKIVLPDSQHIRPPIPPSSTEASQPVTKQIHPSIPVSNPKHLLTESKQETPIPLSSPELSLPQPKQTSPPNPVSSYEVLSIEPKRINTPSPPIRPSLKFPPPTPANATFSAQNQMLPPYRAPQAWPGVVPLPGFDEVKAHSSTLPIRFASPPLATSCLVPDRPTFIYNASALPSPTPVPMAAERVRPLSVLPNAPNPTSYTMPDRPTFTPTVSILPGPALVPTMWASTAHPGSAVLPPPIPPSNAMPARPSFTYKVSALPNPTLVPTMEAVTPNPVKDANYYKNLVRKHGGELPENLVRVAPNGVNQNQLQNLKMDQNVGPKEVTTTLKNEKKICMFFNTAKGCRNGSNCSYLHELPSQQGSDNPVGEQSAKRMKLGG